MNRLGEHGNDPSIERVESRMPAAKEGNLQANVQKPDKWRVYGSVFGCAAAEDPVRAYREVYAIGPGRPGQRAEISDAVVDRRSLPATVPGRQ